MKVCFLARPTFDRFSVAIYKNLKKKYDKTIDGFFVTSNQSESKFIEQNVSNAKICETSAYLKKNWNLFTKDMLIKFEQKYDCSPIWKYIYTDRFLINRDYDYVIFENKIINPTASKITNGLSY